MTTECYFCGITMPAIDEAIEAGWVPSFWDGDGELERKPEESDNHAEYNLS